MASTAQIELWHAEKVATQTTVSKAMNGIHYTAWGDTRVPEQELEEMVGAVPSAMAPALDARAYYFVPLAIADTGETMVAPGYSVELGDRAICHRNASFGTRWRALQRAATRDDSPDPSIAPLPPRAA